MKTAEIFSMAPGLQTPWQTVKPEFKEESRGKRELNIHTDFERGSKFRDSTKAECPVHDTAERK